MRVANNPDATDNPQTFPQETEVLADSKGRVTLSSVGARPGRRYIVRRNADDELTLIPARVIPEREMIVWENPDLAKTILTGIEEAHRGETRDLGSFAHYADEPDDED